MQERPQMKDLELKRLFPRMTQSNFAGFEAVMGPRGYISMKGPAKLDVVVNIDSTHKQRTVEKLLAESGHNEYKLTNDGEYLFILPKEENKLALALIGKNGRR